MRQLYMLCILLLVVFCQGYSDANPCTSHHCANGGTCKVIHISQSCTTRTRYAVCECNGDWSGKYCDMNPCSNKTFDCNNGTCLTSVDGTATCCCQPGCNGTHCDQHDDRCSLSGGVCTAGNCHELDVFDVPCCNGHQCCRRCAAIGEVCQPDPDGDFVCKENRLDCGEAGPHKKLMETRCCGLGFCCR